MTVRDLSDAAWKAKQTARQLRDQIVAVEAAEAGVPEVPYGLQGEIAHLRRIRKEIEATRNGDPPIAGERGTPP